jgi:hypothetical protein
MSNQINQDWERIHKEATIIDVHVHPSLKVSLFRRLLTKRYPATRSFNPFGLRADFPKLRDGGVDVLWSTVYAPERGIYHECRIVRLFLHLIQRLISHLKVRTTENFLPGEWHQIF